MGGGISKKLDLNRMEVKLANGLVHFKEQFPILFECFAPKFSLLPSSTRVVEYNHSQLRNILNMMADNNPTDNQ